MCDKCGFGHLHVHSEYSTLDGAAKVEELLLTAKSFGQDFIAITDHGTTSGLWEAQRLGDKHGIKVIHGSEFYYERETDDKNGHLLILAKNDKGLENMFKMQEIANVHNFSRKPRINWSILKQYHEGLIVTSACLGSSFNQYLLKGDVLGATQWARKFKEVFGDDFYIELQPNSLTEQHLANQGSLRIARQLGIKIVATNDVHYTFESDCFPHEVLLAMQLKKKMSDEKRFKFEVNDFWLKSEEEMYETFQGLAPDVVTEALSNTRLIADKCDARIKTGNFLPTFHTIPEGQTERSMLVEQTMQGAKDMGFTSNREFMGEVQGEIDVIDRNGYSGYFLVVADYVNYARNNGIIVGDGRGSGAGSKTAYLTGITKIPPHEYDLLFERFMADGRQPDFDVDFSDQDAVFEYLQRMYGSENVARIVAFGKMTPKAVTRKVFNTFDHPMGLQSHISRLIGDDVESMAEAFAASKELLGLRIKYKTEFDVIERLEGVISHESQHAGGVIIYPNLSSILPVKTRADDRSKRIVGFDKYMLEELGHYKFDILGLETLPIIQRTLDSIRSSTGVTIDLHAIRLDDREVYDSLCSGDVSGVFQINAQAQKVMEQRPRNFKDLIAINALIRPGTGDWEEYIARRNGKEWTHLHPDRAKYMEETAGIMTYQEQFLLDAKVFAGWSIAYADKHIRKNKNIKGDTELREKWMQDVTERGYMLELAEELWTEIENATGDYSFNKSHAASYAMMTYTTAYLKVKYPEHFYASLMTSEKTDGDGQDAIAGYVAECKSRGIKILPPDINHSGESFVVASGGINYRITTIKHVGESAIEHIQSLRPIDSFRDFLQRREKRHVKQNVLVNLIKAGAFDFDEPNRAELLWQVDMANRTKTQIKEEFECPRYEWSDKVKAEWEKEVLGMYLSLHPMEKYGFKPLDTFADNSSCLQGGEVYDLKVFNDRNGNEMAFVFISTLYGNVKLLCFSRTWANKSLQATLKLDNLVLVRGKRSGTEVMVDGVELLE